MTSVCLSDRLESDSLLLAELVFDHHKSSSRLALACLIATRRRTSSAESRSLLKIFLFPSILSTSSGSGLKIGVFTRTTGLSTPRLINAATAFKHSGHNQGCSLL